MDDEELDRGSIASDFSILPDCFEVEVMSVAHPSLATASGCQIDSLSNPEYHKIEFLNMCASYPSDKDLTLYYKFEKNTQPSVTDRLGIYKVGFSSLQNYVAYQWAPRGKMAAPPPALDGERTDIYCVTFSKHRLPKDDDQFYQACYMEEGKKLRGVTTPFQIVSEEEGQASSLNNRDVISTLEQNDGSVLVTSDLSSLHANINMLKANVVELEESKRELTQQLKAKQEETILITTEMELLAQKMETLEEENNQLKAKDETIASLTKERNDLQDMIENVRETMDRMQQELSDQQEQLHEARCQVAQTEEMEQSYKVKVEASKQELSSISNQLEALQEKQKMLEDELKTAEEEKKKALDKVDKLVKEMDYDKSLILELSSERQQISEQVETKQEETEHLQQTIKEKTESNQQLQTQLDGLKELLAETNSRIAEISSDLEVSEHRRTVLDEDNMALQKGLEKFEEESIHLRQLLVEEQQTREGAEKVAVKMSEEQQKIIEKCNKLTKKCQLLSKVILEHNTSEGVEALVHLHDAELDSDHEEPDAQKRSELKEKCSAWNSIASSMAALELSDNVDGRMSSMMEEMLQHVRQLKEMMAENTMGMTLSGYTDAQGSTADVQQHIVHLKDEQSQENSKEVADEPITLCEDETPETEENKEDETLQTREGEVQNETVLTREKEPNLSEESQEETGNADDRTESDRTVEEEENATSMPASTVIEIEGEDGVPLESQTDSEQRETSDHQGQQQHFSPLFTGIGTAPVFLPSVEDPIRNAFSNQFFNEDFARMRSFLQNRESSSAPTTSVLPPPMMPDLTDTARRAAMLSSMASMMSTIGNSWSRASLQSVHSFQSSNDGQPTSTQPTNEGDESNTSEPNIWSRSDERRRRPFACMRRGDRYSRNRVDHFPRQRVVDRMARAREWQNRMRSEGTNMSRYCEEPVEGEMTINSRNPDEVEVVENSQNYATEEEDPRNTPSAPEQESFLEAAATAGQATETPEAAQAEADQFLNCPMCPLQFGLNSIRLLDEHVDSHLEFVCPICNLAFQRSMENKYQIHVLSHFEDEPASNDPSGPWGRAASAAERFHEFD